jgi:hypothetical protein
MTHYSNVDEKKFEPVNLSLEGLGSAFPLFLVVWIMTFSLMHPQEVVAAAVPEDLTEAVSNVVESVMEAVSDSVGAASEEEVF